MARACCLIRSQPHYRAEAFKEGLASVFDEVHIQPFKPKADDVVVVWNRYGHAGSVADQFEAAGGRAIIAENGYLGRDEKGRQYYALALGRHNGAGQWHVGENRTIHGIEVQPWREGGDEIVILAQRGIGCPQVRQPNDWLGKLNPPQPFRVRPHPGFLQRQGKKAVPLMEDLENARAVVTWASCAGLEALVAGIPVFYGLPDWIGKDASAPAGQWNGLVKSGRAEMLRKVAWAQWTVDEIRQGLPFKVLLNDY